MSTMRGLVLITFTATVTLCSAGPPEGYSCDRAQCNDDPEKPRCFCPSPDNPGGLDPLDIPQFVVITNDDAFFPSTTAKIRELHEGLHNPNGCVIPSSCYVWPFWSEPGSDGYIAGGSDPVLVRSLYLDGHEMASHTLYHNHMSEIPDWETVQAQIVGVRDWLVDEAGVAAEDVIGYRSPFLEHTTMQRAVLNANGFKYDTSIPENVGLSYSPDLETRLWPYSFDFGVAQNCDADLWPCSDTERHPGLIEIPMPFLHNEAGNLVSIMDLPGEQAYELLELEFNRRYMQRRRPLEIFLHPGYTSDIRQAEVRRWLKDALQRQDVWVVTNAQLLEWMENPMTASEYAAYMTRERQCPHQRTPGVDGCLPPPEGGCVNGEYELHSCTCTCYNRFSEGGGWCPDADGRCTVAKTYTWPDDVWSCPGDPLPGDDDEDDDDSPAIEKKPCGKTCSKCEADPDSRIARAQSISSHACQSSCTGEGAVSWWPCDQGVADGEPACICVDDDASEPTTTEAPEDTTTEAPEDTTTEAPEPQTTTEEAETTEAAPETTPEPETMETTSEKPETTSSEPQTTTEEAETTEAAPETTPEPETMETTSEKPETTSSEPQTTTEEAETTEAAPETTPAGVSEKKACSSLCTTCVVDPESEAVSVQQQPISTEDCQPCLVDTNVAYWPCNLDACICVEEKDPNETPPPMVPCSESCGTCVGNPEKWISDDNCKKCADGYPWWPCDVEDGCFCADSQVNLARSAADNAAPSITGQQSASAGGVPVAWVGVGAASMLGVLAVIAVFAYRRGRAAGAAAERAKGSFPDKGSSFVGQVAFRVEEAPQASAHLAVAAEASQMRRRSSVAVNAC